MVPVRIALEIAGEGGPAPSRQGRLLAPGQTWTIAAPVASYTWHTIRLGAAPELAATDACGAGLTVLGMKLE